MPIDQMMLGPMLDPFKNMADECTAKGYSGEHYDAMMAALNRMESLGQELDDFMEYSTKISTEGLQMAFSNAYGQLLAQAAQPQQSGSGSDGGYDDQALLNQNLDALRNAVSELKKAEQAALAESAKNHSDAQQQAVAANEVQKLAKTDQLIAPIENLIAYGESGVNFPTFLRVQIEKGLDKAMEGSGVLEEGVAYELAFAKAAALHPYQIRIKEEATETFNRLKAQNKFGVPNSLSVSLAFDKIEHKYMADITKWEAIEDAWERIFSLLDTWTIAHTSFAPYIEPWSMSRSPSAAVSQDKDTLPGYIAERIRLLSENFSVDFNEIMSHETFVWSVKHHHFNYSQVYTEFLIQSVLPQCKPGNYLNAETIAETERLYNAKEMPNPENHKVPERQAAVYDQYFGAGSFAQKFGANPDYGERNAAPWSI